MLLCYLIPGGLKRKSRVCTLAGLTTLYVVFVPDHSH